MILNKPTRGGARPGAGRKLKYNEPTQQIVFNVPVSQVEPIKAKVLRILKKLERNV